MAIAPTATISNIVGTTPCIEPMFKNLYVTSNLSGEFTAINQWLVQDLEAQNLWDEEIADALKAVDGKLSKLKNILGELVEKYPDIFELEQTWLIRAAAVRGKWIDQSQSLNLFVTQPSGKYLHELYTSAWKAGLKTTYYLRTLGASQIEKSTVDQAKYGKTHTRDNVTSLQSCAIDNPECESCQ
jgi:ribonucleoside-diphosphate reductase alpha chain